MRQTMTVDFNELPAETRARIVNSTAWADTLATPSSKRIQPLFTKRANIVAILFGLAVLGLTSVVGLDFLIESGFGVLDSLHQGVQTPEYILLYIIAIFSIVLAGFGIPSVLHRRKALPFSPGLYVFPLDVVQAMTQVLRITPLSEVTDIVLTDRHVHLPELVSFTLHDLEMNFQDGSRLHLGRYLWQFKAERIQRDLQEACARAKGLLEAKNPEAFADVDLFSEVRVRGGFKALVEHDSLDTSEGPRAQPVSRWADQYGVAALAAGVLLGLGVYLVRNYLSDERVFAQAKAAGDGRSFHQYLKLPGRHGEEAFELGERADFAVCEQHSSEECWSGFLRQWEDSPRAASVRERLGRIALDEHSGSVTALREFRARHPGSVVDAEARTRIHQRFESSWARFEQRASTQDPALVPLMRRLFAYNEATGRPYVAARFRRENSPTLAGADRLLTAAIGMPTVQINYRFEDARTDLTERAFVQALAGELEEVIPADVLVVKRGERLPPDSTAVGQDLPTLAIKYQVAWNGAVYDADATGRRFPCLVFTFDVQLIVPKGPQPLHFKRVVSPRPSLVASYGERSNLYRIQFQDALDDLRHSLYRIFFRPESNKP